MIRGEEKSRSNFLESVSSMGSVNGDQASRGYGTVAKNVEEALHKETLTLPRKLAYGVGHVLNDLAASMWFTYFILFYHMVLRISNVYAGLLVLIGQLADALATPVVGYLCDNTDNRYGGRKTWHLIGSLMVALSLFFFWHECIYCSEQPLPYQMVYFASFIICFQVGWATVQVSHLALIPQLTSDENERVGLTSLRYSATIFSNLGVFVVMFVLLASVNSGSGFSGFKANSSNKLQPDDQWIFSGIALGIIVMGLCFVAVYHIGTKEPPRRKILTRSTISIPDTLPIYKWFLNPHFYLVGVVYMSSRLVVNLTQVYGPLYILDSVGMSRLSVAIFPLVIFLSGLGTSFTLKKLNKVIGRYKVYFIGLCFVVCASVWFRFWPKIVMSSTEKNSTSVDGVGLELRPLPHYDATVNLIYIAAALTGIGGTTLLVTSLSMVADLIGKHCGSSAFVYGAMSFTDKLSNGIAIQLVQALHPCKGSGENVCCEACSTYYRRVVSYVPGGACLIALVALVAIVVIVQLKDSKGAQQYTGLQPKHTIQKSDSSSFGESSNLIKNN